MPTEGTKISGFSTFTALDGLDYLLGNDVSDVSMSGVGTTKKMTLNALKSWLAIPADLSTDVASIQTALSTHNHDARYYTETESNSLLLGKSDVGHSHAISDVTGLNTALSGKADSVHTHAIADTTGLQAGLDSKAASSHTHIIANVTGLQAAIDAKADASHTHVIANVTGLQSAIDAKANTVHSHAISDVTGLQASIDAKANASHVHAASDINSGVLSTARLGTGTPAAGTYVDGATGAWTALPSGGGGSSTPLTSNTANPLLKDATDATKLAAFNLSAITTGTTRTFTFPNSNMILVGSGSTLVSGRVPYLDVSGLLTDTSNFTVDSNGFIKAGSYQFIANGAAINNAGFHGLTLMAPYTDGTQAQFNVWDDGIFVTGKASAPLTLYQGGSGRTSPFLSFQLPSSIGTQRDVGSINFAWGTSTDSTRLGMMILSSSGYNGNHEGFRLSDTGSICQASIPIANVRDAVDDAAAAALSPSVPVGGLYRTGSILKIRVS